MPGVDEGPEDAGGLRVAVERVDVGPDEVGSLLVRQTVLGGIDVVRVQVAQVGGAVGRRRDGQA